MSRAPEPLATHTVGYNFGKIFDTQGYRYSSGEYSRQYQEDIPIQEVYTQRWEPKTSTSARAAGIAFIDNRVVFVVRNFPRSGFEIWVSREGEFGPYLR